MYKKITAAVMAFALVFTFGAGAVSEKTGSSISICASAASADDFIATAHDISRAKVYHSGLETEDGKPLSFNMSGRTYFQGFTIQSGGAVSFNAESIKTLDFTIGHVDDSEMRDSHIEIQFDGNKYADFDIPAHTDLLDYHLDITSGTTVVTVKLTTSGWDSQTFGFANVCVDGSAAPAYTVPEYAGNYELVKSAYNKSSGIKTYDDPEGKGFNMNGRTYYQGFEFAPRSGVAFNVDNVDTLTFMVGHVDDTNRDSGELVVWVDGSEYEKIPLEFNMPELEYELDVSKAKEVYLYADTPTFSGANYAAANIKADSFPITKNCDSPSYSSAAEFINSGFNFVNKGNSTVFDGVAMLGCNMNGRSYYQGIVFNHAAGVSFNVDNVDKLSFSLGHVDDTAFNNGKMSIYADNKLIDERTLDYNMPIDNVEMNVSDYSNVRFYVESASFSGTQYMMGNITIDGKKPERDCVIPDYADAAEFIRSAYNKSNNVATHDGKNKIGFRMNGKDVYQGVVIPSGGKVGFNTENVGKVTFKAGHVDDTGKNSTELEIYLDNMLKQTIKIEYGEGAKEYTINVNKFKNMFIVCNGSQWSGDKYALADISIEPLFDEPDALLGDVNDDGFIDVEDAVMIIASINGVRALDEDQITRADVEGSDGVNIEDAVAIINHVNGVRTLGT